MLKRRFIGDPVLLLLLVMLAASLIAFVTGALPYPIGWLILLGLIMTRILHHNARD